MGFKPAPVGVQHDDAPHPVKAGVLAKKAAGEPEETAHVERIVRVDERRARVIAELMRRCHAYPFTAPIVTPRTTYFWKKTNTIMTGMQLTKRPVIMSGMLVVYLPTRVAVARVRVFTDSF
jgi:hypothetical protein